MTRTSSLVEREPHIDALASAVRESTDAGNVVLISGEAGFGKTSLVAAVTEGLDHRFTVLRSACEPVGIPAPFAPLFDLIDYIPDELRTDIQSGARRPAVYAGMLDFIKNERTVLILEDMHWADEATMGLARYLGRRIEATNSTLIITYRSEEVGPTHPFRLVIADLGRGATRIDLPPLTPSGVEQMTRGLGLDASEVHQVTLGNPFFVEEIIRHPDQELPPTIENAILANLAQLSDTPLDVLFRIAVSPDGLDLDVVLSMGEIAEIHVDTVVQRKLLAISGGRLECRHDLIRETILRAIPPVQLRRIHADLLDMLESRASGPVDTTRLAYHSVGAGDPEKSARYSLAAAEDASRIGAHRQAAFHYAEALQWSSAMPVDTLDVALLEAAREHGLINAFADASDLASRRIDLAESDIGRARARAWLSFFRSRENDMPACRREASHAIEVLGSESPSEELALALAVMSWAELVEGNPERAVEFGDEAILIARSSGASHVEVHAATTCGSARELLGDDSGIAQVEEAIRLGLELDTGDFTARAMNNLGKLHMWRGRLQEARAQFAKLVDYSTARELDAWYIAAIATRATIDLALGDWEHVDVDLEVVLGQNTCRSTEVETLATAARLRARRGDPGSHGLIMEVLSETQGMTDRESLVLSCSLAMEAAWMGLVEIDQASARYDALRHSLQNDRSGREVLGFWARRLGLDPPDGSISGPVGLEWSGRPEDAATAWDELGFPVEAAISQAVSEGADLNQVFATLLDMGAEGVVRGLQRELRKGGVAHIPRGERRTTRENPAGLTNRQSEVLGLMATGLSNAEIADELFISEKTASHHVSAVLSKLNATSRLQAVALASANGWVTPGIADPN